MHLLKIGIEQIKMNAEFDFFISVDNLTDCMAESVRAIDRISQSGYYQISSRAFLSHGDFFYHCCDFSVDFQLPSGCLMDVSRAATPVKQRTDQTRLRVA